MGRQDRVEGRGQVAFQSEGEGNSSRQGVGGNRVL